MVSRIARDTLLTMIWGPVVQTMVMTGASRGIGGEALARIVDAAPGAHVLVVVRDAARQAWASAFDEVRLVEADLARLPDVASAAQHIARLVDSGEVPPISTMVLNAGIQRVDANGRTEDGFEPTFAVNVLANHVLVRSLADRLQPRGRVVITVSDTHFGDLRHNLGMVPGPQWHPVETLARAAAFPDPSGSTAGRAAYSTSKLAAIYLVHEYARRLPTGWTITSFNPGFVPGTDLARDADAISRFAMRRVMPLLTLTPLATSPSLAGRFLADAVLGTASAPTGAYIDRDRVAASSPASYDRRREREAWEAVEALTARFLPSAADPNPGRENR